MYVVCNNDWWWDRYCRAVPLPVTLSRCAGWFFSLLFYNILHFLLYYHLYMVNKDDYNAPESETVCLPGCTRTRWGAHYTPSSWSDLGRVFGTGMEQKRKGAKRKDGTGRSREERKCYKHRLFFPAYRSNLPNHNHHNHRHRSMPSRTISFRTKSSFKTL